MFWQRRKPAVTEETAVQDFSDRIATEAEGYFRSGKMHCAEAVLFTIRNHFSPETPEEIVRLAAGFGGGSGSGCICGAVSGGTMAIGLVLGSEKKRINVLTKELHHWFKEQYGSTCCRIITTAGKKSCPLLTGNVAGKVAELLQGA